KQSLFDEVALAHLSSLYYAALRLTGNPVDAEDLLQETFTRAYGAFDSFTLGTNARAWLYRIMSNTYINQVRQAESRLTYSSETLSEAAGAATIAAQTSSNPEEERLNPTLDHRLSAA